MVRQRGFRLSDTDTSDVVGRTILIKRSYDDKTIESSTELPSLDLLREAGVWSTDANCNLSDEQQKRASYIIKYNAKTFSITSLVYHYMPRSLQLPKVPSSLRLPTTREPATRSSRRGPAKLCTWFEIATRYSLLVPSASST